MPDPGDSQAWNRYSYTSNNPVKYTDPSGHGPEECPIVGACEPEPPKIIQPPGVCADNPELCKVGSSNSGGNIGAGLACNGRDPECLDALKGYVSDITGVNYSSFEIEVINELYLLGHPDADWSANYIINNGTRIWVVDDIPGAGFSWWHSNDPTNITDVWIDRDQLGGGLTPFVLSGVSEELFHMEQGIRRAISVGGELEAWQRRFNMIFDVTGIYPGNTPGKRDTAEKIMNLSPDVAQNNPDYVRELMKEFSPGYNSHLLFPWKIDAIYYPPIPTIYPSGE